MSGADPSYFRIKALQKSSPAKVILEAVSDAGGERSEPAYANYVVRSLTTNLRLIANRKRLPANIDVSALESYREMTGPAERRQLEVTIKTGNNSVLIDRRFRETLEKIVGDDEYSYGSVSERSKRSISTIKIGVFRSFPQSAQVGLPARFAEGSKAVCRGCRQVCDRLWTSALQELG